MREVEVTIRLPEALIERARAAGVRIEDTADQIASMLEAEIKRREAAQYIHEIAEHLRSLPDSTSLLQAEIETIVRQAQTGANSAVHEEALRQMQSIVEQLRALEPPLTIEEIEQEIHAASADAEHQN